MDRFKAVTSDDDWCVEKNAELVYWYTVRNELKKRNVTYTRDLALSLMLVRQFFARAEYESTTFKIFMPRFPKWVHCVSNIVGLKFAHLPIYSGYERCRTFNYLEAFTFRSRPPSSCRIWLSTLSFSCRTLIQALTCTASSLQIIVHWLIINDKKNLSAFSCLSHSQWPEWRYINTLATYASNR